MAADALREPVVDFLAPRNAVIHLASPRVRRRSDRVAGLLLFPPWREGLEVLDDFEEVLLGHSIPGQHGRAVQAATDDADEVLVVGQGPGGHGSELEDAQREVSRGRAQRRRGRALSVSLVAMAGAAVEQVRLLAGREDLGRDDLPPQLHRLLEAVRVGGLARRGGDEREGQDDGRGTTHAELPGHSRYSVAYMKIQTPPTKCQYIVQRRT